MKKNILSVSILISGILISSGIISLANAQTTMSGDVQYPISELGNCKSKDDCKVFCDSSKNSDACLAFAGQHNLMSLEELANAKKFQDTGMVGPGGCKGQVACEQYCGTSTHLEECTAFGKKNGMMSDQQLQDSQKVLTAIKNGLKPPACAGGEQCNAYCSNPVHMEECMTFSLAAGIVPDNQKAQMQKTLDAIKLGAKPPACQPNPPSDQLGQSGQTDQSSNGLPACDEYCGTHQEECMSFSLATGMVPDNQKGQVQKTLDVFKQGINPPACQPNPSEQSGQSGQPNQQNQNQPINQTSQSSQSGQGLQACDQYCADSSHVEECVKFSVAIGNMTQQQGQTSIKNGGKGPGGCIGKDACNTFCNNSDNQETCFNFGKDNGMIPQADLQKMQDGQQKMKDSFSQIPPEVLTCITDSVGADVVDKMKSGAYIPSTDGDAMNKCFQSYTPSQQTPGGQNSPGQPGQPSQNPPQLNQQNPPNNQPGQVPQNQPGNYVQTQPGTMQPQQQNQPGQPGQIQPGQIQPGQPGENQPINQMQPGQLFREKIEPNQPEPSDQPNQNQPGQPGQPNQMQPQQPQLQPQPLTQPNPLPPSSPTSFLQGAQVFLANVLNAFR